MKEATLSLSHPILFVMDFDNPGVEIPEYSSETIVSSTHSCISVRAVMDVDGDTTVKMAASKQGPLPEGFACVFYGSILTPTRKIAVVTSDNARILESHVSVESTRVRIGVNKIDFPDVIFVEVESSPAE